MPFAVTPLVGVVDSDINPVNGKTFSLGNSYIGSDGHLYVYAQATGAIAASAVVVLTEPAFTAATGAGAFTAPPVAMIAGDRGWFKKTAI
ncbi:MAG: hypothetical protein ACRC6I_18125 [Paracoccaceae bacterium]